MTRNVGTWDRVIRAFLVAPVAIVLAFILGPGSVAGIVLFAVAGIMLASSTTAFCPTYILLGISTHPSEVGVHRVGHHLRHT
jgi:hypothetical protein